MSTPQKLGATWVIAVAMISYASFHDGQGFPQPRRLIGTGVLWTALAGIGMASGRVAEALAFSVLVPLGMVTIGGLSQTSASRIANPVGTGLLGGVVGAGSLLAGMGGGSPAERAGAKPGASTTTATQLGA